MCKGVHSVFHSHEENTMAITVNELVRQLAILGVVETAANGSFHDLPGSGGSGGGNSVMIMQHVEQNAEFPLGSGVLEYTYPTPLAYPAFIDVLVLDPVLSEGPGDESQLDYAINVAANRTDGFAIIINTSWNTPGKVDPLPAFDQQIGVKYEAFVPSVTL